MALVWNAVQLIDKVMKKIILDIKGRFLFNIVVIRYLYIWLVPYGFGLNTVTVVMPNIDHLHVCRG